MLKVFKWFMLFFFPEFFPNKSNGNMALYLDMSASGAPSSGDPVANPEYYLDSETPSDDSKRPKYESSKQIQPAKEEDYCNQSTKQVQPTKIDEDYCDLTKNALNNLKTFASLPESTL